MDQKISFNITSRKIEFSDSTSGKVISAIAGNDHEAYAAPYLDASVNIKPNGYVWFQGEDKEIAKLDVDNGELTFTKCTLNDEAMLQLKEVLAKNKTLKRLVFFQTSISSVGIQHLAEALKNSPYLKYLYFIESGLDDKDCEAIGKALKENRTLTAVRVDQKNVFLNHRRVGNEGELALVKGLKENYSIVNFYIWRAYSAHLEGIMEEIRRITGRNKRCNKLIEALRKIVNSINNFFEKNIISNIAPDIFKKGLNEARVKIQALKQDGHPDASQWEREIIRIEKKQAILFDEKLSLFQLFDLYSQYFQAASDETVNSKIAEKLFVASNEETELEALGFTERLRYQWIMKLLKNNRSGETEQYCIASYRYLIDEIDSVGVYKTLEAAVGVDKILTVAQLEKVKKALESSKHEIFGAFKVGQFVENFDSIAFSTEEEKFAAEILNALNKGQKIAIYEQVMLKKTHEEVKFLPKMDWDEYEKWLALFTLQMDDARKKEEIWETQFLDGWHYRRPKINLLNDIADMIDKSVYQNISKLNFTLSAKEIDKTHSRILSGYRLATLSALSFEEIKKILQIEYHALPDQDKKNAFHYTFWRYCTLERGLEDIFEKNNMLPLNSAALSEPEKMASFLLRWIGDQERSLAYKTFKSENLFNTMLEIGHIAHHIILSNESNFETVKSQMIEKLHAIENKVNIDSLINEINQKFTPPSRNTLT